ncbi:uncharacterized protein LOC111593367 isoform X1 [Drosophila hydei]|uniref:Uncharacterized protein LOC111593367 isoform X1 n=1 Tax=Drosophila hydei TaxID=7224 RepID=A0A6J1L9U4_DROHY|nr:uncharacterized protein LOC111593367 isoform X1 [Drosophila hydei]
MSSSGSVLISATINKRKRPSSCSLICLSTRPSATALMLLMLLFGMCSAVVQSADNFDALSALGGSHIHRHHNNSDSFDMHYDNFSSNEPAANNDTRILRRGKRYLEFTKGSRMSWRTNGKNNLLAINTLFAYGYGFRTNYPFPDAKEQRQKSAILFKRDLFSRLESALDGHGFDGRACLLKSFCTAIFDVDKPHQKSGMLFKLLKLIFSLEDQEKHHIPYLREENCQQILHSHCPLSFDSISPYTDDV